IILVIASAAKQSRIFPWMQSGLLRCARNDGVWSISIGAALLTRRCQEPSATIRLATTRLRSHAEDLTMARYRLHSVGASGNSFKVALFLTFARLDWEPVGVGFAGGEVRSPDWRAATNVMGEVPVLEADGRYMSQSGAILLWLAETHGVFGPTREE